MAGDWSKESGRPAKPLVVPRRTPVRTDRGPDARSDICYCLLPLCHRSGGRYTLIESIGGCTSAPFWPIHQACNMLTSKQYLVTKAQRLLGAWKSWGSEYVAAGKDIEGPGMKETCGKPDLWHLVSSKGPESVPGIHEGHLRTFESIHTFF